MGLLARCGAGDGVYPRPLTEAMHARWASCATGRSFEAAAGTPVDAQAEFSRRTARSGSAVAGCLILVADLFVSERRRNLSYSLSLTALAAAALSCWDLLDAQVVQYAFGGMFVTDPMAQVLKLFACLATGFALVYAQNYARGRAMWRGELFSLALFTLLGVMIMISANNLLLIYLGLELQSLALYALVALRRDEPRAGEAAMKYFVLGALASGFLLYGMSMLYGATGPWTSTRLHTGSPRPRSRTVPALVLATVFLVAGIGFKLGAAPFHMWVPDVYHGAPHRSRC